MESAVLALERKVTGGCRGRGEADTQAAHRPRLQGPAEDEQTRASRGAHVPPTPSTVFSGTSRRGSLHCLQCHDSPSGGIVCWRKFKWRHWTTIRRAAWRREEPPPWQMRRRGLPAGLQLPHFPGPPSTTGPRARPDTAATGLGGGGPHLDSSVPPGSPAW